MKHASIIVRALWDEEAKVWVASTRDIDGLSVEAETLEALETRVIDAITDLMELNGSPFDTPEIPIHVMAERLSRIPNPAG
ncbi:MAG: DUF1902 domain-containing protein [Pseudomonadota bacterium]